MSAELRIYLNNTAATDEQLALFGDIRVDQAIGMAAEAELDVLLDMDDTGVWSGMEEDFTQPFSRIRVEVKVGDDGEFIALIDGPIVAQRFELSSSPEDAKLILVVQDDSVLLNQTEEIEMYEDMTADEIAESIFTDFGLDPDVDPAPDPASPLARAVVQRGTAMQLLRELARRYGMFTYVVPGEEPGISIGKFVQPVFEETEYPQIVLMGEDRNIGAFNAQFDALRPVTALAGSVGITDKTDIYSEADAPDIDPLGDEATHDIVAPAQPTILARTREETSDIDEATMAAVNLSSFAYTATAEIDTESYEAVLEPYKILTVAGAGGYLSGDYLISRVTHLIDNGGYKQQFSLRRNARSAGSSTSLSSLFGGIF
jgi:hypothetical protein